MEHALCKLFGHRMFFDTDNVAGPSSCSRCEHTEAGIEWPRAINTIEVDMESKDTKLTEEQIQAQAAADDYRALNSEEVSPTLFPTGHVVNGLLIAAAVIVIVTVGILIFA